MSAPLLQVAGLGKRFALGHGATLHALADVGFNVQPGEALGIVGESGCGKTTLSRIIARLADASDGSVQFDGTNIAAIPAARFARDPRRSAIQLVFQDATDSLNPRFTAAQAIAEPLRRLRGLRGAALAARVAECAALTGLPGELLSRYPHQLSGGQKARVGIARAIAPEPRLLVLDEPTSALDVSVQAVVLQLLAELRTRLGLTYLFVSHDLNVVRLLCDRVMVMYLGRIAEIGRANAVFDHPAHPYTRALAAAIPTGEAQRNRALPEGEPMSPVNPDPHTCRFASRCAQAMPRCREAYPPLLPGSAAPGHLAACHLLAPTG